MQRRVALLNELINLDRPVNELAKELSQYGSDGVNGEALVVLTREQTINALSRFINDDLSAEDIDQWAEYIELREDIDFGYEEDGGDVFEVIADIDTSRVFKGQITKRFAEELIKRLRNKNL